MRYSRMRLPKGFRPEKDLEEKTAQLIEEAKVEWKKDKSYDFNDTVNNARRVARDVGELKELNTETTMPTCYEYRNREEAIDIAMAQYNDSNRAFHVKVFLGGDKVLDTTHAHVIIYTPGDWEDTLLEILHDETA